MMMVIFMVLFVMLFLVVVITMLAMVTTMVIEQGLREAVRLSAAPSTSAWQPSLCYTFNLSLSASSFSLLHFFHS